MAQININYTVFIAGRSAKHNPLSSLIKVTGTIFNCCTFISHVACIIEYTDKTHRKHNYILQKDSYSNASYKGRLNQTVRLYYVILWTMAE